MSFHCDFSSRRWKIPALSLLVLAPISVTLGACGDSGASQDEIEAARKQGAAKARQQQKIQEIEKELKNLKKGKTAAAAGTVTPAGSSSVGAPAIAAVPYLPTKTPLAASLKTSKAPITKKSAAAPVSSTPTAPPRGRPTRCTAPRARPTNAPAAMTRPSTSPNACGTFSPFS